MIDIACAIAPVFLTILAGMIVEKTDLLPRQLNQMLGLFVIDICMPCLIFHIFANITPDQLAHGKWWLCALGAQVGVALLCFVVEKARGSNTGEGTVSSLGGAFCNAAFIGFPIVLNILPGNGDATMICGLVLLATNVLVIPALVILDVESKRRTGRTEKQTSLPKAAWRVLRRFVLGNPMLMATLLGAIVALCRIPIWAPLDKTLADIGYIGPSCMLFSLGLGLRENLVRALRGGTCKVGHQLWLMLWKLVLLPLIAGLLLVACGYTGLWVAVPVIIFASGTATVTSVIAELYHARAEETSLTVVLSSTACLFTIAGWIWVLQQLGYLP